MHYLIRDVVVMAVSTLGFAVCLAVVSECRRLAARRRVIARRLRQL